MSTVSTVVMPDAQIIIRLPGEADRETKLSGLASIGRAFDNTIRVEAQGVSRYHAIIEARQDGYWLSDLSSVNGTKLNGVAVTAARDLRDGDIISIGDVATLIFHQTGLAQETVAPATVAQAEAPAAPATAAPVIAAPATAAKSKSSFPMIIGVVAGLAVIGLVAVVLLVFVGGSDDPGEVHIISPQSGAAISDGTRLRVKADHPEKIGRVVYRLDGVEVARGTAPPNFEAALDPDGLKEKGVRLNGTGQLSVVIEDRNGKRQERGETVAVAISAGAESDRQPSDGNRQTEATPGSTSLNYRALAEDLAYKISKKRGYIFNSEFLAQVERYTQDYRDVTIDEARRTEIIRAFSEANLSSLLGLTLAMSLSKFKDQSDVAIVSGDTGIGMMRMPAPVALQMGYIEPGGADRLKDSKQNTRIAASYVNALIDQFGQENFVYAIACYGVIIDDTRALKEQVGQANAGSRADFWKVIKSSSAQRSASERVARFFAAGIVGAHPEQFSVRMKSLTSF